MPKSKKNRKSLQSYNITEIAENFVKVKEEIIEKKAYKVEMNKTASQQFQQHLKEKIKEITFKNFANLPIKKDLFGKTEIEKEFEIMENFEVLKTEVLGWRELSPKSRFRQIYDAFKANPLTETEAAIIRKKLLNVVVNYHEDIITQVEIVKKADLDLTNIDCVNKWFRTEPPAGETVIKYKINDQYYEKYSINDRFHHINEQYLFLNIDYDDKSLIDYLCSNPETKQKLKEICQPIGITFLRNIEANETFEPVNSNPEKCVYVLVDDTNPVQGAQITKQLITLAEKSFPTLQEKAVATIMQTLKINERDFYYNLNKPPMAQEYKKAYKKLKSAIKVNADNIEQKLTPQQLKLEFSRAVATAQKQYQLKKQTKAVASEVVDNSGMTEYFDGKEVTSLEVHEQTKLESTTLTNKKTQKTLRSLDQSRLKGRGKGQQTVVERLFTTEKPVETPKKADDTTKKSQKQADYESSISSLSF